MQTSSFVEHWKKLRVQKLLGCCRYLMSMRYKRKFPIAVANVTAVMEGMQPLRPRAERFPDVPYSYITLPVSAPVRGLLGLLQLAVCAVPWILAQILLYFPVDEGTRQRDVCGLCSDVHHDWVCGLLPPGLGF